MQECVDEEVIGSVNFDAIETGRDRLLGGASKIADSAVNVIASIEEKTPAANMRTSRRGLNPAAGWCGEGRLAALHYPIRRRLRR